MTEIDDLLDRIETPATEVADDVARGRRALRRRQRWQVAAVAVSVLALAGAGFALEGRGHPSANAGFSDQPGTHHDTTARSAPSGARDHRKRELARAEARRALRDRRALTAGSGTVRSYHDVLAEHLDPHGDLLAPPSNEQGGGGSLGSKFDWNHGGMLEIVVGRHWDAAGGFYLLETAGMRPTTYDGRPARVSTTGSDTVVSVQHPDGTIVTLIASTSFGNNGTSTAATHLTQHELLAAAADERLVLPARMG